jgi:hypothetical protein
MDRTIINLASILIGGAGLFTVLTGWNVPETTQSFFGDNPFAIKRDAIAETSDYAFAGVALLALVLQLGAEIWGNDLPERRYGTCVYTWTTVLGLLCVGVLAWALSRWSRHLARRIWIPRVIGPQLDLFDSAAFVVAHNGFRDDEVPHLAEYSEGYKGEQRAQNWKEADQRLRQIERLFDVSSDGELAERVARLRRRLPRRPSDHP